MDLSCPILVTSRDASRTSCSILVTTRDASRTSCSIRVTTAVQAGPLVLQVTTAMRPRASRAPSGDYTRCEHGPLVFQAGDHRDAIIDFTCSMSETTRCEHRPFVLHTGDRTRFEHGLHVLGTKEQRAWTDTEVLRVFLFVCLFVF